MKARETEEERTVVHCANANTTRGVVACRPLHWELSAPDSHMDTVGEQ